MAKVAPQWSLSVSVGAKPTPWSPLSSSLRRQTVTGPDAWKQKEEKSETNWANGYIDREGRDSFENEKRKGLLSFVLTDSADEDPRMNWIYDIINRRNTSFLRHQFGLSLGNTIFFGFLPEILHGNFRVSFGFSERKPDEVTEENQ